MRLKRSFFDRDTTQVAKELLGKTLVRRFDDGTILRVIITETEAYHGFDDRASHASRKKTERNKIMFEKAGLVYVYLVYGMHYCLNFVTMGKGFPAAVLVRAVALTELRSMKYELRLIDGPGRVCKELKIDKSFYGEDLTTSKRIWVETKHGSASLTTSVVSLRKNDIIASKRIGVDYAGESAELLWNLKIRNFNQNDGKKTTK